MEISKLKIAVKKELVTSLALIVARLERSTIAIKVKELGKVICFDNSITWD